MAKAHCNRGGPSFIKVSDATDNATSRRFERRALPNEVGDGHEKAPASRRLGGGEESAGANPRGVGGLRHQRYGGRAERRLDDAVCRWKNQQPTLRS